MTEREQLVARWLELMRAILPGLAAAARWPIRFDHCFMRVCLDHAIGQPWHERVRRPAVRHMTDDQLRAAIAVAERIAADPSALPRLNAQSMAWRKASR